MSEQVTFKEVWRVTIRMLGSLKLAVILLLTIAIACAVATLMESKFNSAVAQHYIYQAPWFIVWLLVLCVNLAAATLTRWPWKKKHLGFVVTHLGIIILLIGALVGRLMGFEGFVHLRVGEEPTGRVTLNKTMFQVESPADGMLYAIDFPLDISPPSKERPRRLAIPNSYLHLNINGCAEHVERQCVLIPAREGDADAAEGVELEFKSSMMGQEVRMVLLNRAGKNENTFFGRAWIRWANDNPMEVTSKNNSEVPKKPLRETHVIFARLPNQPVLHAESGKASGLRAFLLSKSEKGLGSREVKDWKIALQFSAEETQEYDLVDVIGKRVVIWDKVLEMEGEGFWHDFTMRGGMPANQSDEVRNPTVIIHYWIYDEENLQRRMTSGRELQLWGGDGERVNVRVIRSGKIVFQTDVGVGESFAPGWADWKVELKRYEPLARVEERVLPAAVPIVPVGTESGATPGLHVQLIDRRGVIQDERWIVSGEIASLFTADGVVRVGFGLKTQALPFTVQLDRFEVPRDEGTDSPSNFLSHLTFRDLRTGEQVQDVAQMNFPASFPGGVWRSALGLNYKFSQASWNPNDLNVTTLQVLYDPGWPLKWTGSLILSLGIGILFMSRKASFE
jgi:hypothetical protein